MPKQVVREYIDRYISNSWGLAIITLVIAKGMLSDSGVIAKGNVIICGQEENVSMSGVN